jgi:hypothetical protein
MQVALSPGQIAEVRPGMKGSVNVWIGPQSYFDARHLIIEDYVGWGLRAKVLGPTHSGFSIDMAIVQTDLEIKPVRIGAWADK